MLAFIIAMEEDSFNNYGILIKQPGVNFGQISKHPQSNTHKIPENLKGLINITLQEAKGNQQILNMVQEKEYSLVSSKSKFNNTTLCKKLEQVDYSDAKWFKLKYTNSVLVKDKEFLTYSKNIKQFLNHEGHHQIAKNCQFIQIVIQNDDGNQKKMFTSHL